MQPPTQAGQRFARPTTGTDGTPIAMHVWRGRAHVHRHERQRHTGVQGGNLVHYLVTWGQDLNGGSNGMHSM